jgi:hypothetical protein
VALHRVLGSAHEPPQQLCPLPPQPEQRPAMQVPPPAVPAGPQAAPPGTQTLLKQQPPFEQLFVPGQQGPPGSPHFWQMPL